MVESDTTASGERVVDGRYRLVRPLGRGAMGAVYEAVRLEDGARVAVKLVHPHLSKNDVNAARFAREVRLTQELDHPGIIRTFDAGLDGDGSLFLVMELLEGQTLRDRIVSAQYTPAQAVWILTEVLRALAVAHRAGIVHRDLKPENIFLARTPDGHEVVKLLDFGIARELESASVTRTETTVGTPSYMAPEQATSAKTVGPAADVWAVGVMLYRVLTGALPFTGDGPYEVVLRVCSTPHPPVLSVAPDADPVLAAIVERCLEKDYRTRPGDADALLTLLEPLVERPRGLSHVVAHGGATVLPQRARPASRELPLRADTPMEAALASGALTPMAPASRAPWVWGLVLVAAGVTGAGLLFGLASADPTPLEVAAPAAAAPSPASARVEATVAPSPSVPAQAATPEPVAAESRPAAPPSSPARLPGATTPAPRPSERRARATAEPVAGVPGAGNGARESAEDEAEVEIAKEPAVASPSPAPAAPVAPAAPELPPLVAAPSPSASTAPSASASAAKPAAPTPSPSASASKKPKAPPFVSF